MKYLHKRVSFHLLPSTQALLIWQMDLLGQAFDDWQFAMLRQGGHADSKTQKYFDMSGLCPEQQDIASRVLAFYFGATKVSDAQVGMFWVGAEHHYGEAASLLQNGVDRWSENLEFNGNGKLTVTADMIRARIAALPETYTSLFVEREIDVPRPSEASQQYLSEHNTTPSRLSTHEFMAYISTFEFCRMLVPMLSENFAVKHARLAGQYGIQGASDLHLIYQDPTQPEKIYMLLTERPVCRGYDAFGQPIIELKMANCGGLVGAGTSAINNLTSELRQELFAKVGEFSVNDFMDVLESSEANPKKNRRDGGFQIADVRRTLEKESAVFYVETQSDKVTLVNDNSEDAVTKFIRDHYPKSEALLMSFLNHVKEHYQSSLEYQDKVTFVESLTQNTLKEGVFVNAGDDRTNRFSLYVPEVHSKFIKPGLAAESLHRLIEKHAQVGDDAAHRQQTKKPGMYLWNPSTAWKGHDVLQLMTILKGVARGDLKYAPVMETWCQQVGLGVGPAFFELYR